MAQARNLSTLRSEKWRRAPRSKRINAKVKVFRGALVNKDVGTFVAPFLLKLFCLDSRPRTAEAFCGFWQSSCEIVFERCWENGWHDSEDGELKKCQSQGVQVWAALAVQVRQGRLAARENSGEKGEGSQVRFMLCTAPGRPTSLWHSWDLWHGRHLSSGCDLRSSVQAFNHRFLGFEAFPWDFNYQYPFSLCCSDNFRMCQSAYERGGWPCLTSELSWKPVDCDWWLVDSASFSVVSREAASHYYLSRDLTVTGSSKEFSSANENSISISMKSFATLEVIFRAWDQHDHCEKPIHLYIHCLIADHDT